MMIKNDKVYILLFLIVFFIILNYFTTLWHLFTHDLKRGDYNYGYLIPFVIAYLIWEKRKTIKNIPSNPSWKGFVFIFVGIFLFWFGELAGEFYTQYISLWLMIVGILWCYMGWEKLKIVSFPIILLLFMFPLPRFVTNQLTLRLQLISSKIGVIMLQFLNIPAYREGNIIDLGITTLQVVEACSGLRYIFPLFVLGMIITYLSKIKMWKKLLVILSVIPLAILMNGFRIALSGILYKYFGPKTAETFFHEFSGFLIFILSFLIIYFEAWFISKILPDRLEKKEISLIKSSKYNYPKSLKKIYVVVLTVLFINTSLIYSKDFSQKNVPILKPLSSFPVTIGKWKGIYFYFDKKIISALDLSDYVNINYKDNMGRNINFYVAYYETQNKGKSIHPPRTCLIGSGWVFKKDEVKKIRLSNGKFIKVRRLFMHQGKNYQICYYWYYLRGRIVTDAYKMKLYNFIDSIIRHRTDGALIRIITPVYLNESIKDADKRIISFINMVYPILVTYLPA